MKTKDKILRTALTLFVAQGIDRTTTKQITDTVGVAEGTLFVHYKTKQELVDQLFVEIKTKEMDYFVNNSELTGDAHSDHVTVMRVMGNYFLEHFDEYQFIEMVNFGQSISDWAREEVHQAYAPFVRLFADWKSNGVIKDMSNEALRRIIWSMLNASVMYAKENNMAEVTEEMIEASWDAIAR